MKHHITYTKPMLSNWRFWLLLPLAVFMLGSCKKTNLDYKTDYRVNTEATNTSNLRLVNLSPNQQMVVNGDSLTNFYLMPLNPTSAQSVYPPTKFFPATGLLPTTWNIPQELIRADGTVRIRTSYLAVRAPSAPTGPIEFTAKQDANQAKDYYLTINNPAAGTGVTDFVEVPRDITTPSKPDHFKIRVVNLCFKVAATNPSEDLASAYTLAYADGTPVSATTTGVQAGNRSAYIEVPYGTYQFKVLTADGRQVPTAGGSIIPSLSTMPSTEGNGTTTSGQTAATIKTYQPGGVYTIVIHPSSFNYSNGSDADLSTLQNSFRIISDISEPENLNYARVQIANALPESQLQLRAQGTTTAAAAYSTSSNYQNVVVGKQRLEVLNATGQVVAQQEADLLPGGNYTLWVYPDANNTARSVLVSNSLSGTAFIGQNNDGGNATLDRLRSGYFFNFRFLNFCPELPYVTFTNGQGVPFRSDYNANNGSNLQFGIPQVIDPLARLLFDQGQFYQIMAYTSAPGKIPGDWLSNVAPINSMERLVARPQLYTNVNRRVPAHEPGVYSIALIGRQQTGSTAPIKLMIVKHTK